MTDWEPEILRWESPPPRVRAQGKVDWHPVAQGLRERTGEWALLYASEGKTEADDRRVKGLASNIRNGLIRAFAPKGEFEASSRMIGEEVRLYARHVGASRSEPEPPAL